MGQLLGSQGFWPHQVLRGVGGWGSRIYSAPEGMATGTGQSAPVFLPGEHQPPHLPPRQRSLQATVYRVAKNRTRLKWPCMRRHKPSLARGSSAPVRVHEGAAAAWLARTLAAPSVQGHPTRQELWPYQSLFEPLVAGDQMASLASLSPQLCPCRHLVGSLAWAPPLFITSGT